MSRGNCSAGKRGQFERRREAKLNTQNHLTGGAVLFDLAFLPEEFESCEVYQEGRTHSFPALLSQVLSYCVVDWCISGGLSHQRNFFFGRWGTLALLVSFHNLQTVLLGLILDSTKDSRA